MVCVNVCDAGDMRQIVACIRIPPKIRFRGRLKKLNPKSNPRSNTFVTSKSDSITPAWQGIRLCTSAVVHGDALEFLVSGRLVYVRVIDGTNRRSSDIS
jgi:hypothetical protein